MANKTKYAVDNVDTLIDFLWNNVPLSILETAIQEMIDEGLITVCPKSEGRRNGNKKSAC